MEEEYKKQKYNILLKDIYHIKTKLKELVDLYYDLNQFIKEGLLIDDQILNEEDFSSLLTNNKDILNDINMNIIPNIKQEI